MSRYRSKVVEFHCANDCVQTGCPGHRLQLEYCISSDIVTVLVDDEHQEVFDDNRLAALVKAYAAD